MHTPTNKRVDYKNECRCFLTDVLHYPIECLAGSHKMLSDFESGFIIVERLRGASVT